MTRIPSSLPFNYETITITQSRINKAILAIPASLSHSFPRTSRTIEIYVGDSPTATAHKFTPYSRKSKESRISGMREFYRRFGVRDGDEVVVQQLADGKYRFLPEICFQQAVAELEKRIDAAPNDASVDANLLRLSNLTNTATRDTLMSEYCRLAETEAGTRKVKITHPRGVKESAPPSIRKLLAEIYGGKCQVTGFGFSMRSGKPYFEIHHIRPDLGNHLKNVLLVCPNAHAQFTYAFVEQFYDDEGWLRKVRFNGQPFSVRHAIDAITAKHHKEVHSEA